jgi:hypothetical protein
MAPCAIRRNASTKAASVESAAGLESMSIGMVKLAEAVRHVTVVAPIKVRRAVDFDWRIETPPVWAVENSVGRQKSFEMSFRLLLGLTEGAGRNWNDLISSM